MTQNKIEYEKLTAGFEFPPAEFVLNGERVNAYLEAVEGDKSIYEKDGTAPPMAVAALSLAAMAEGISMPPGAIHVSQDIKFLGPVRPGEQLVSRARVNRKVERGKIRMLAIGINVTNEKQEAVLSGETSFILPPG